VSRAMSVCGAWWVKAMDTGRIILERSEFGGVVPLGLGEERRGAGSWLSSLVVVLPDAVSDERLESEEADV
jgi:hypothetical protein